MAIDLKDLRMHVEQDHARANQLRSKASQARQTPMGFPVDPVGMNPPPKLLSALNDMAVDRDRGLRQIETDPFFAKVETSTSGAGRYTFYISKARSVWGALSGDDWSVCSWTAPAPSRLLDQPVGHQERIIIKRTKGNAFAPPKVDATLYSILASAKYGAVFPRLRKAEYLLRTGKGYVDDAEKFLLEAEEQVGPPPAPVEIPPHAEPSPVSPAVPKVPAKPIAVPEAKPQERYKAAEHFGLSEIIALTSVDQRAAMHLPFADHVMIEGPPGSGKTSIGIMRIPCLLEQQWVDLELDREKDDPRYRPEWTRVLVLNPEMVPYLKDLITSLLDVEATKCKG